MKVVLFCVDERFARLHQEVAQVISGAAFDAQACLKIADSNDLLYPFCVELSRRELLKPSGVGLLRSEERRLQRLKDTVRFVNGTLKDSAGDFAFIKLHKRIPYVAADIDLLVKRRSLVDICRALNQQGALRVRNRILKRAVSRADEIHFAREGLLGIDIYTRLAWFGLDAVTEEFLWKESVSKSIFGSDIDVPRPEAEALILTGHALFWHGTLTLLDVIHIYNLLESTADCRRMLDEARRFGWEQPMSAVLSLVRKTYEGILFHGRTRTFPLKIPIALVVLSYLGLVISAVRRGLIARSGVAASRMAIHLGWMIVSRKLTERYKEIWSRRRVHEKAPERTFTR